MWPVLKMVTIVSSSLEDWGHHINVASLEDAGSLEDWGHHINVASLEGGDDHSR